MKHITLELTDPQHLQLTQGIEERIRTLQREIDDREDTISNLGRVLSMVEGLQPVNQREMVDLEPVLEPVIKAAMEAPVPMEWGAVHYYTRKQVGEMVGKPEQAIYQMEKSGKVLPPSKVKGHLLYDDAHVSEIRKHLRATGIKPSATVTVFGLGKSPAAMGIKPSSVPKINARGVVRPGLTRVELLKELGLKHSSQLSRWHQKRLIPKPVKGLYSPQAVEAIRNYKAENWKPRPGRG